MGLLDDLAAAATGGSGAQPGISGGGGGLGGALGGALGGMGGGGGAPNAGMLGAILGALQTHPGGLGGLLSSFQQAGLGDQAGSWVGTGENQPVSPDQMQSALGGGPGGGMIGQIASRLGVPSGMAAAAAAQYLPQIIDHLTPHGQVPQDGGMGGLGGLLSRLGR